MTTDEEKEVFLSIAYSLRRIADALEKSERHDREIKQLRRDTAGALWAASNPICLLPHVETELAVGAPAETSSND